MMTKVDFSKDFIIDLLNGLDEYFTTVSEDKEIQRKIMYHCEGLSFFIITDEINRCIEKHNKQKDSK